MDNNGKDGSGPDKKKNPLNIDLSGTKDILNPETPKKSPSGNRPFVSGSKADLFSEQGGSDAGRGTAGGNSGTTGPGTLGSGTADSGIRTNAGNADGGVRNPDSFRSSHRSAGSDAGQNTGSRDSGNAGMRTDAPSGAAHGTPGAGDAYAGGSPTGSKGAAERAAAERYAWNTGGSGPAGKDGAHQYSYVPYTAEGGADGLTFTVNGTVITHVSRQDADFVGRPPYGPQSGSGPEVPGTVQCDLGKIRTNGSITIGRGDFSAPGGSTILTPPYASKMFGPQEPGSSWTLEMLRYASGTYQKSSSHAPPPPYGGENGPAASLAAPEDAPPARPYGTGSPGSHLGGAPPIPPDGSLPSGNDGVVLGASTLADRAGGTVTALGTKAENTIADITKQTVTAPAYIVMNGAISASGDVGSTVNIVRFPAKVCKDVLSITVVDRLKWSWQNAQTMRRNDFIDSVFGPGAASNGKSVEDVRKKCLDEFEKAGVKGLDKDARGARGEAQGRKIKRQVQSEIRIREKQGLGSTPQLDHMLKTADDYIKCNRFDENPIREKASTKAQKGTTLLRDVNMIIDRQLMKSDAGKTYVQTRRAVMTGVRQIRRVVKTVRKGLRAMKRSQLLGAKDKVERLTKKIEKNKAWGLGTPGQNERLDKRLKKAVDKKAGKNFRIDKTAQRKMRFAARRNRIKGKMPSALAAKAAKKAGEKVGSAVIRRMEKRALTRAALKAAQAVRKSLGKVIMVAGGVLSTAMVYVWIGVAIAAAWLIIMVLTEELYVNLVTGAFNFGNLDDLMYNTYWSYTEVANATLTECYRTDMERMADYAEEHATYSGTSHIELIDYDDMDYYAEIKDLDDVDEQVLESTNAAEILSMVYAYFGLDPEEETYDEESGETQVAYIDFVGTIKQYYYYTHEITAKESVTYDVRETGEMIEQTVVDAETGEEVTETVPETETITITNVDFTYESYYFPDMFARVEEYSQQKALKETPFTSYSTSYYGTINDEQDVYVAMRAAGFTHAGACGVMGNIMQESTFNPNAGNGTHYGLAQWGNDAASGYRWLDVVEYCNTNGYDLYSFTGQTNYLIASIKEDYSSGNKSLYGLLTTSNDVDKCAEVFCALYEVAIYSGTKESNRYHYGNEYPTGSDYYQDMSLRVQYAKDFDLKYGDIQDTWEDYVVNAQGQAVVDYACQFIGNPYVSGGESLTNGCDCSGFVMKVYEHFGVSLPHSSSGMQSVGVAVSESDIQPGDIVCYYGHVGIYIGDGQIVNSSNSAPYPEGGIKVTSPYNYREIVTIRRIFT